MTDHLDSPKQGRLNALPLTKLFPNMVTILGLCAGLTAIRFALLSNWQLAVTFIVIAAFIDGMDGRLARLLNASSKFGAQLDSLADFVNFGVAPVIVLYLWILKYAPIKGLGWALVLLFAICMAVRLARFNSELDDEESPEWKDLFFAGIPAPCSAGLSVIPMMLSFKFADHPLVNLLVTKELLPIYVFLIALLTASRLPTFSIKKVVVKRENSSAVLVTAGVFFIFLITEPWITLPAMGILYFLSIPLSLAFYFYKKTRTV